MSTASARVLETRLQLQLAMTDSKAHRSVLSCTLNRTSRDAVRSEDDGLYQATIDGGGLAYSDEVIPTVGYLHLVFTSEDNG
jgi:hypothetical protein